MDNIITRLIALPVNVKGLVVKDENDDYNIYLNKDLSAEECQKTADHERQHIIYGHFWDDKPVLNKEADIKKAELGTPPRY